MHRPVRWAVGGTAVCLTAWLVVAVLGPSAAAPALGAGVGALDLGLHPSSATVSVLMALSVLSGGVGLVGSVLAVSRGWQPRRFLVLAGVGALLLVLVPPVGSADHLSYAAYGRIAALGGDPYSQPPDAFAGGTDPVASAVRDPWRSTTSVYGPVGGLLMALCSVVGGDSVRTTVWAWQVLLLLAWALVAVVGHRVLRDVGDEGRERAWFGVLFTANPLLLTVGLGGAHADVLAGAAAVLALLLAARSPVLAGVALAVAVGTKLPYGVVAVGIVVAAVSARRLTAGWLLRGALAALVLLVPAHLWAGVHVYDQTRTASRFVSLATVWRPLVEAGCPGSSCCRGPRSSCWSSRCCGGRSSSAAGGCSGPRGDRRRRRRVPAGRRVRAALVRPAAVGAAGARRRGGPAVRAPAGRGAGGAADPPGPGVRSGSRRRHEPSRAGHHARLPARGGAVGGVGRAARRRGVRRPRTTLCRGFVTLWHARVRAQPASGAFRGSRGLVRGRWLDNSG